MRTESVHSHIELKSSDPAIAPSSSCTQGEYQSTSAGKLARPRDGVGASIPRRRSGRAHTLFISRHPVNTDPNLNPGALISSHFTWEFKDFFGLLSVHHHQNAVKQGSLLMEIQGIEAIWWERERFERLNLILKIGNRLLLLIILKMDIELLINYFRGVLGTRHAGGNCVSGYQLPWFPCIGSRKSEYSWAFRSDSDLQEPRNFPVGMRGSAISGFRSWMKPGETQGREGWCTLVWPHHPAFNLWNLEF